MADDESTVSENLPTRFEGTELSSWNERPGQIGAPYDGDEGPDWKHLGYVLWNGKWWILAAVVLGVVAGYVAQDQLVTHTYQTTASVWVETADDESGPIEAADITYGSGWSEIFRSNSVLQPVAEQFQLYLDVRSVEGASRDALFENFAVTEDVMSGGYRFVVDTTGEYRLVHQQRGTVERGEVGGAVGREEGFRWSPRLSARDGEIRASFRVSTSTAAARDLASELEVVFNPQMGNIITTHFTSTDPERAARIHNAVVDSAISVAYDLKTAKMQRVVDVLQLQADSASQRLQQAELALEEYRVQNVTEPAEQRTQLTPRGITTQDPVFNNFFQQRIAARQLRSRLEQLRDELAQTRRDSLDVLGLQMIPAVDSFPALSRALDRLTEARAERRALLDQYTGEYPRVQKLTAEIEQLRDEEIPDLLGELIGQLESRVARLEEQIDSQASELREIPTRTIEEARRRREMEMAEELHNDILSRLKEAQLAASTSQPDLQVVDQAQPPGSPENAGAGLQYLLMATMGGLGLGIGGVLLRDRLDSSVQDPEDVEGFLQLPILGVIPRIGGMGNPEDEEALEVLESFRSLRNQLSRIGGRGHKVLLVTSPAPEDGKSLVASNLAISYATTGLRTALVDADLRRGNAETFFDAPGEPGVLEYLQGRVGWDEIVQPTDVDRLNLISHGNLRRGNPDLVEGPRMAELMQEVRRDHEVVILDAAPLVAGVDAMLLGDHADKALLVLRAGSTNREIADTQLEVAARFDLPLVGAVLNDVPDHAPYYRYYSSYSAYPAPAAGEEVVA